MLPVLALSLSLTFAAVTSAPARPAVHAIAPALQFDFETAADTNATWPAGWRRSGNRPNASIALDGSAHSGAHAVRIVQPDSLGFVGIANTLPDSLRELASGVRLTGWLRTERAGSAGLWLRTIGLSGAMATDEMDGRALHGDMPWTRVEVIVPIATEARQVLFGVRLAGGGTLWVDDLELQVLDGSQLPPSAPAVRAYLDAGLDSLCRRSVITSTLNWGVLQRAGRSQMMGARKTSDAWPALRYAVRRLDDAGTFATPAEVAARLLPPSPNALALPLPHYLVFDTTFDYIAVQTCTTYSAPRQAEYVAALRSGMNELDGDGTHPWIVDLRSAGPGLLEPTLAGLAPLFGNGPLGGWSRPNGKRGRWTIENGVLVSGMGGKSNTRTGTPVAGPPKPLRPIAVIVGPHTTAEGEALAVALRGRPRTKFFGEPSAGRGYRREVVKLADGAELQFSTARLFDRNGAFLEGRFQPEETVSTAFASSRLDSAQTVALQWLKEQVRRP